MGKYILKRLLLMIPVILGISLVVFTLIDFAPGDAAQVILGPRATPEALAAFRAETGLDQPFWVRYLTYLYNVIQGDFGNSFRTTLPVMGEIVNRLPVTLKLGAGSMVLVVFLGVTIGIISAVRQYSILDNVTLVGALVGSSMPGFWLGTLLILLFALQMGVLPATFSDNFRGYLLPWITMTVGSMAGLVRNTRSNMLEVIGADYIKMAQAKGASEKRVILGHALRNALLPIVTMLGMRFIGLLGSTVIMEQVFAIPGLSSLALISLRALDTPVIMGIVLVIAIVGGFINLFVDIIYVFIDPRLTSMYIKRKDLVERDGE